MESKDRADMIKNLYGGELFPPLRLKFNSHQYRGAEEPHQRDPDPYPQNERRHPNLEGSLVD